MSARKKHLGRTLLSLIISGNKGLIRKYDPRNSPVGELSVVEWVSFKSGRIPIVIATEIRRSWE